MKLSSSNRNAERKVINTEWAMPAITTKPDGEPRQVGIEVELQGIAAQPLAKIVQEALGGTVRGVSRSEFEVDVPSQGTYRIEVDYTLLKELAKEEAAAGNDESRPLRLAIDALDAFSSLLVPCEIVSPPMPMTSIPEPMDAIVNAVRDAGANGTRKSLAFAFGVHFNIEPPDMQASTVLAFMRAFTCLFDWIVWAGEVDLSRRVTPYIDSFPRDYRAIILDPAYDPDFTGLIDDYLVFNATRNRALDMLPLFASVDKQKVMTTVDDDRIKSRPAFHYRLANSCVDEPGWSIAQPWSRWLKIEKLAGDADALAELCEDMRANDERILHPLSDRWRRRVQQWLARS